MNFLKDFYAYVWDIFFKFGMPLRAMLVITSAFLILLMFLKVFSKPLRNLVFLVFYVLIEFLIRVNYFLICRFRKSSQNAPLFLVNFDDFLYSILETSHNLIVKTNLNLKRVILFVLIVLNIWIALSFTNALKDTRVAKYSSASCSLYYTVEEKMTTEIGIAPASPKPPKEKKTKFFSLNEKGVNGTNIREKPSTNSKTVAVVNGNISLEYMNKSTENGSQTWYLVKLEDGKTGWVSSNLINERVQKD